MGKLTCTNCFRDTGVEPDFEELPVEAVIALVTGWLCNECLSDVEQDAAQSREAGHAD